MRFLADMGISPDTVAFLRDRGHDAVHLGEQRLHRLSDSKILAKALEENRILLTHDLGFGALMTFAKAKLPSVVTFRLANMSPVNVNAYLENLINESENALSEGVICTVTERRVRIRHLPI